ncbi:hypothetical protein G6F57_020353 [Rhizopus arrhizus]|nr:hypothetical protein G6F57_020353 [Rhizopus arrhizus]
MGVDAPQAGLSQAFRQAPRILVRKALGAQAVLPPVFPFHSIHSAFRIHAALLRCAASSETNSDAPPRSPNTGLNPDSTIARRWAA